MWGDKAAPAYNLLAGFILCNTGKRIQEIPFHARLGLPALEFSAEHSRTLKAGQSLQAVYLNSVPMFSKLVRIQVLKFIQEALCRMWFYFFFFALVRNFLPLTPQ